MPLITDATSAWSTAVTISGTEIWQARGRVFISTEASPAANAGLVLENGDAIKLTQSQTVTTVRYRTEQSGAQLYRMPG